jgi:hypothetical protein
MRLAMTGERLAGVETVYKALKRQLAQAIAGIQGSKNSLSRRMEI